MKSLAALGFLLAAPVATATVVAQTDPDAFAVRNVRVFDGDRVLPTATVVVRGGRIAQVSIAPVRRSGVTAIDGSGHTLLPGLIDAHVHTSGDREALIDAAPGIEADLFSVPGAVQIPPAP